MSVTTESEPTTNSADFDPIFPDPRDFLGDGVFFTLTEMLLSYIFVPSVVKYGIPRNNRRSYMQVKAAFFF